MGPDEVLFLEGAEDIDILGPSDEAEVIQVKETKASGSVTLRSIDVLEAIHNYWQTKKDNSAKTVRYRFLTTSERGKEKPNPFNKTKGLDLWDQCKKEGQDDNLLRKFLLKQKTLPQDLRDFIQNAENDDLRQNLFMPLEWDTGKDPQADVERIVQEKLIAYAEKLGLAYLHSEYEVVINAFLRHVWDVVRRTENRKLDRADFLREFEKATTESVDKSVLRKLRTDSATLAKIKTAPFQISAPLADFTGREKEITSISSMLLTESNARINVHGMPGVGKTELALCIASNVSGDFPDGRVVINFRGTDDTPLTSENALRECITAFIGLDENLPDDLLTLRNLYQTVLHDKKALLIFDNVNDWRQISNLLPPTGCVAMITSRSPIAGVSNISLGVLSAKESVDLLQKIVPNIHISVANLICELCGYLPLAIRAAGSLLSVTEDLDPSDYATELQDERTRLEKLGDEGVEIGVKAVFNLAYRRLPEETQRVFRNLAVFKADFDSQAEEFVCEDIHHEHLSSLVRHAFVSFDRNSRRYQLHELVRLFAASLSENDDLAIAKTSFARFYISLISYANSSFLHTDQSHQRGLELFDRERENIRTSWEFISNQAEIDKKFINLTLDLLLAGGNLLLRQLPPTEFIKWCEKALSIAKKHNHEPAEVTPLWLLGLAYENIGELNLAENSFRNALTISKKLGNQENIAHLLEYLGRVLVAKGKPHEGITCLEEAKQIFHNQGQHKKEGSVVSNLSFAYQTLNDGNEAFSRLKAVLNGAREEGNKFEEANALGNLANYFERKDKNIAVICIEQAANLYADLGYRDREAICLSQAGLLQTDLGERTRGIDQIKLAVKIHQDIDDKFGETYSVGRLGQALVRLNKYEEALSAFDEQIGLAKQINSRDREASALGNKAIIFNKLGRFEESVIVSREALTIAQLTGNTRDEFIGLCHLGEALAKLDLRDDAVATFEHQVEIAKVMDVGDDVRHSYKHLADLYAEWGNLQKAIEYMEDSVAFCKTSKDPHDYPDSTSQLADFLARDGRYREAIEQGEISIKHFEKISHLWCADQVRSKINIWK